MHDFSNISNSENYMLTIMFFTMKTQYKLLLLKTNLTNKVKRVYA